MSREELLFNIVITAVEGGVNYWADVRNYKWCDEPGKWAAQAVLIDYEDDKRHGLTFDVIEKGLALICKPGFQLRKDILSSILVANRTNDAGDIDSEAADCIVQAGLFGEIIYG